MIGFLFGWGRLFVSQHGRDQLHEDWPELYIAQQGFDLPAEEVVFLWLFDLRLRVHLLLGGVISFFLATMISLIALMDHPFRGEVGVSAGAFQLIYDQLMKE